MNENNFTYLTEELKRGIDNEISYIYSCFVPEGTDDVLAVMKGNIVIADREFLDSTTRISVGNGWTCPYDLMINRVKRQIEDFYAEIDLSSQSVLKLSEYGDRADVFKKSFAENLKKSEETTKKQILRELELMVMQGKDVKTLLKHINAVIDKRADALKTLLAESAGQMERYMVLWDYQDEGYTEYRFITIGDNCEQCNAAGGSVFKIDSAAVGTNLPPLHPNCNCRAEILDNSGNPVVTLQSNDNNNKLDYLKTSLKQVILGNYTDDSNLLGTLGQLALGFIGLDLPADIRDLMYDITNWKLTPLHALQTILDAAALLPVVGSIKYSDEALDAVKGALKYGENTTTEITKVFAVNRIPDMTKKEIIKQIPNGWNYKEYNGFVHIRDKTGKIRMRMDPPDRITQYPHVHIYDDYGNSIDINGNVVSSNSPNAHIPYKIGGN